MKALELHDQDGDRLVVSDFNEDTPESARGPSPQTEAKLTVHQHTIMDNPATDLSDIVEDGVSVLLEADDVPVLVGWLLQFFNGVDDAVTLTGAEAKALRAHLKGHTVADTTEQLKLLGSIGDKLEPVA